LNKINIKNKIKNLKIIDLEIKMSESANLS